MAGMLMHPQFDPVALQLGPVSIHWYGITYLVAFGLFLLLAKRRLQDAPYAAIVLYWGIEFTQFGWNQSSELADMPMWWIFIAWPLCGALWLAFLIDGTLRDMRRLPSIS